MADMLKRAGRGSHRRRQYQSTCPPPIVLGQDKCNPGLWLRARVNVSRPVSAEKTSHRPVLPMDHGPVTA
jgi:hypothetical protein